MTVTAEAGVRSRRDLVVLTAGHLIDDLYQGAVPALVPFFVAAHQWSYAEASGITLAATLLSSVVQPVFGLLTDRRPMPWLVPVGMSVAGAGIGLSGLTSSYLMTWLAIALSGLGVAAYHPEAARLARVASRGSHTAMSWFSVGGSTGFALAPVAVAPLLETFGVTATWPLLVPALAGAALTTVLLRSTLRAARAAPPKRRAVEPVRDDWPAFAKLTVVIIARSIAVFGLGTFLALFVQQRLAAGVVTGEVALVLFYGTGAVGILFGGRFAGRWGRAAVLRVSYALGVPAMAGLALVPGPVIFGFIVATALALFVPFSLHVTLGQDYLPNRVGTASGVTLGLAVSVGGLAAPVLGGLADATGLRTALVVLIAMPLLAALMSLRIPDIDR
ncbi:MFS transporter [Amycolatopsis nigrescens]|uniref:MFS transporter n=1 Tax=Amycolatopsis nigrescens TaxID=381445 RepID=UPI0003810755|nr:MFS transporter [Amycolatopsis nigrescens]